MAKQKQSTPMTDSGATNPRPMSAEQHAHFKGLVESTLTNAVAVGHGHAVGSQGPRGHKMVESGHAKQAGGYIPQGALADAVPQNRQNQSSKDGGSGFDDPDAANYASVDDKD